MYQPSGGIRENGPGGLAVGPFYCYPAPVVPPRPPSITRRNPWRFALLGLLLLGGVALERTGVLDWRAGVALAAGHAGSWWLPPALALVTAALFAAGLPGSLMTWVAGILLPPLVAAPVVVAGGVAGALGAYALARAVGGSDDPEADDRRLIRLLARRSDFTTLLAVRLAPGFPHSAINLAAGLLRVPRGRFLASTALGLAVKGTLYVTAVHQAAHVAAAEGSISWRTLVPLAGLALLLLLAPQLRRLAPARAPARPGRLAPARREPVAVPNDPA